MLYEIPYSVSYTKIVVEKIKNQKSKIKNSKSKNQKKIFALFNQTVHRISNKKYFFISKIFIYINSKSLKIMQFEPIPNK